MLPFQFYISLYPQKVCPKYTCDIPMKPLFTGKTHHCSCQRHHQVCGFSSNSDELPMFRASITHLSLYSSVSYVESKKDHHISSYHNHTNNQRVSWGKLWLYPTSATLFLGTARAHFAVGLDARRQRGAQVAVAATATTQVHSGGPAGEQLGRKHVEKCE